MTDTPIQSAASPLAFTFGEPMPVMDRSQILDFLECYDNGRWYEPPVSLDGLARTRRASVHHDSALILKRNLLVESFKPHRLLSRSDFGKLALDYLVFGNAYLEQIANRLGQPMKLAPALAKYTRRGKEEGVYWWVPTESDAQPLGRTFHLIEPDINQELYGLPEYLAALQSAWLNESATLFRRRYYLNGSHAGFILYMTDPATNEKDVDALRTALKNSKGPGNFRNLFMYSPSGKKDGLQLIPISEVAAKDEFIGIKNVTRDDVLAAHRVPPQLLGIIPQNSGGFGDIGKAREVFYQNEIRPLQIRFMEVNEWLGEEVIQFNDYQPTGQQ